MFIAIKEIKKEKLRYGMILAVIVLISFLVYFLSSLAFGLSEQNRTAIDHWGVDGVITSDSANNNLFSSSLDVEDVTSYVNDNTELVSLTNGNASINNSKSTSLVFMGFQNPDSTIIPPIIEGEMATSDFEVLISSNIRDSFAVAVGDYIKLANTDREFKITGFTEDSNFNTLPVVYGKREMLSAVMMSYDTSKTENDANSRPTPNMPDRVSFLVVKDESLLNFTGLENDVLYVDVDTIINELPGYRAQILTFGLMIISLSIIVSIILGIFMYILTMQKKSIFAVLKIQGYQNKTIINSIIFQIIILVITGLIISLSLNQLAITFLPAQVPVKLNVWLMTYVSIFILITSLFGAIFSAYSVLKIDPLEAL